jgi:3-oxoacyl-[acyl-carrier protein] reductase
MILKNKNAIIYGGGGSLGSAVAKAFAGAGARVFLVGRTLPSLKKVADEIAASGGKAEIDQVDAMVEKEVSLHIEKVLRHVGAVDISFNAIDLQAVQDIHLVEMNVEDFLKPITVAMKSQFLTATLAGKIMKNQHAGTILSLTATPGGIGYPLTGGFAPACAAIESLSRNLAAELGVYGVRVVNIRSAGSPDSNIFRQAIENNPDAMAPILQSMENDTMLKKLPLMGDIANVAVFLASDLANKITGVTIDVTGGTTVGLNYRVPRVDGLSTAPNYL